MKKGGNMFGTNNNNPNMQKNNGVITSTINEFKDNKEVLNPMYTAAANIGIATNVVMTIILTVIFGIVIYIGFWLKNSDSEKTSEVLGKYKNVDCEKSTTKDSKNQTVTTVTCYADIIYTVDDKEYIKKYIGGTLINENQPVTIYYDPSDPENYVVGKNYYYIGLAMIIVGFIIIGATWIWLILSIVFKPIAAATGVNTIGDALF